MARDRDYDEYDDKDKYEDEYDDRGPRRRPNIPTYLAQAILVTLFCCLPFGIVSIVYAAQVNSKLAAGDIAGAREASDKAKMWSWISFGVGIPVVILSVIIQVALQSRNPAFR
jgi:hypothetical protein